MLVVNLVLLLIPTLCLGWRLNKKQRWELAPLAFLYIVTSAFLSFIVLYALKVAVSLAVLWTAFFISSLLLAPLVRNPGCRMLASNTGYPHE